MEFSPSNICNPRLLEENDVKTRLMVIDLKDTTLCDLVP